MQYGRKKKRKVAEKEINAQPVSPSPQVPPAEDETDKGEEEEEEEEEDEEGEEDASKYDLFAGMDDTELLSVAA